ncbi:Hypothetical protein RAK1035_2934 [Roseovarius sp. AK1035]|nr:Hypothetical protein RAK1035_2934 [Roseovarius sp. AK1035]
MTSTCHKVLSENCQAWRFPAFRGGGGFVTLAREQKAKAGET